MERISIKLRVMLAVLLAVIISSSLVTFTAYFNTKNIMEDRLNQTEMPTLVKGIRDSVNNEINEMKIIARSLAENPLLIDWAKRGANPDTEKLVVEYLAKVVQANGFNNASFVDRDEAKYWNQKGFLRVLDPDRDSWFFKFKASGNSELASVYRSSKSNDVSIFVNYQETNGRGMSGVSKPFDEMVNYLNSFKLEESGFVYLVDAKGLVKVHHDNEYNDKKTLEDIHSELDSSGLFAKQDYASTTTDELVISSSYIESLGWYVVAEVPKSELFSTIDRVAYQLIVLLIITSVIFAAISYFLATSLMKPINRMAAKFSELGKGGGDLTQLVPENQAPEIAELAIGFNSFVANIRNVVQDVVNTSESVKSTSDNVNAEAETSKLASEQQRNEAHQVSSAISEMGSTISEIAENANIAAHTTTEAAQRATSTQEVVGESTRAINQMAEEMKVVSNNIESLADKTNNISGVLDVIRGISDQTNLLALNAAIEAARAGDHGRGFAVVADEVRGLAQRTSESTDEIHRMITELQDGATKAVDSVKQSREQAVVGVDAAKNTSDALQVIVGNVLHISDLNTQIATATEQQSAVIKEINVHVVSISDSTEQSADAIGNIKSSSDEMKHTSTQLNKLVGQFLV